MSFRCDACGEPQLPRTKPFKKVVQRQSVTYPFRKNANVWRFEGKINVSDDPGGEGWRIVKEESLCPECV